MRAGCEGLEGHCGLVRWVMKTSLWFCVVVCRVVCWAGGICCLLWSSG